MLRAHWQGSYSQREERDFLTFGKGVLMSMVFLRLLNNQTNFFKDSK